MTKNKKGFTLIELLAVIVILALVTTIGVVAMTSTITSTRLKTMNRSAAAYIDAIRTNLTLAAGIEDGDYYIHSNLMEKGGVNSPYDNKPYRFNVVAATNGYEKADSSLTCEATADSFVRIATDSGRKTYSICLTIDGYDNYFNLVTEDFLSKNDGQLS